MGSFCCSRLHLSTVLLVRINNRNRCISCVHVVYISYEEYRGSDMTACILPETHCTGFIIPFHCMPMVHGAGDPRVASIHCEPGRGSQHPLAREWGRHSCDLAWTLQVSLLYSAPTRLGQSLELWTAVTTVQSWHCLLRFHSPQNVPSPILDEPRPYTKTSCWSKGRSPFV